MLVEHKEKIFFASHYQFYIEDPEIIGEVDSPDFWTEKALTDQLACLPGVIGIGTGSYGNIKVVMEKHDLPPQLDPSKWDHITEAGLDISKGRLQVVGCLDDGNEEIFEVVPGHYRVRCCHANLIDSVDVGMGGDWYLVQFWPGKEADNQVIKYRQK